MTQRQDYLTPEERAQITEIQDLLLERFVARKKAIENDDISRVRELQREIEDLQREKENVMKWTTVESA
jgi:hypothetical protein